MTNHFLLTTALAMLLSGITAGAGQFPPLPPGVPPPPGAPPKPPDPGQGGTTTDNSDPLATPVIVVGPVTLIATRWAVDFTVCNIDQRAMYETDINPAQQTPIYNGNPPEDFIQTRYSQNGGSMTPPCPGGLTHAAGLKPYGIGPLGGDRPCGGNRTYNLAVTARRGQVKVGRASFSVASVGPCPPKPPEPPKINLPPIKKPPGPPVQEEGIARSRAFIRAWGRR